MKKLKEYIKENKYFIIIMALGMMAFILQMKEVVLYADDFVLGNVAKSGISGIIKYFKVHYTTWGGGYTALIATIYMMFDLSVWKISHCIVIFTMVFLSVRMISFNRPKTKAVVAAIIWILFFMLSIWVSRETIYWFDGALAYTFSTFQLFLYFYLLYSRMEMGIQKKYDVILIPMVAFLAGWSTAQTGPIAVFITILFFGWQKFIKKEKITKLRKVYFVSFILCIIGLGVFMASPGNGARMDTFTEYSNFSFVQKIMYRVDSVYGCVFDFKNNVHMGAPFYIMLELLLSTIVTIGYALKEENKKIKIFLGLACVIQAAFVAVYACISFGILGSERLYEYFLYFRPILTLKNSYSLTIKDFVPYVLATLVMISNIICIFYLCIKKKSPFLLFIMIMAYISQGIMVMAPYSPIRTTFYMIVFLWISIAYLIVIAKTENIRIGVAISFIVATYDMMLGIVLVFCIGMLYSFNSTKQIKNVLKCEICITLIGLSIIAAKNYVDILIEYKCNKNIFYENMRRIEEYKNSENKSEELKLVLPKDDKYGFTPLVGIDWVEVSIKDYFDIDRSVKLISETYDEYIQEYQSLENKEIEENKIIELTN